MKWKSDSEVQAIVQNFSRRCGARTEGDDWNVFWGHPWNVQRLFHPDLGTRLRDDQLVNHFPNHLELTRKDQMVKNVKRWLRERGRDGQHERFDFVPVTHLLPADYSLFVEEFRRCPRATWIMKPANAAQGRGIFLVTKLAQLRKWSAGRWAATKASESYVISRYVDRPHLVGGRKYDLRLYVLVTSYRPLRVYKHREGFARFCTSKYDPSPANLGNPFVHLTNVAVQKRGADYNQHHGGKWNLRHCRLHVEATRGRAAAARLFADMDRLIVDSLRAVQARIINDRHCFECYGYDIIIDAQLKPWLVEVNASPSLTTTTPSDRVMKMALIRDVFEIVLPKDVNMSTFRGAFALGPCQDCGGFSVLYDEAAEAAAEKEREQQKAVQKSRRGSARAY